MDIIPSPLFSREARRLTKKYPSLAIELAQLIQSLQHNPPQGESLGKSCYKIRLAIASKNTGKSGGARVITCVRFTHDRVDLLTIFDKSEQASISNKELSALIKLYISED